MSLGLDWGNGFCPGFVGPVSGKFTPLLTDFLFYGDTLGQVTGLIHI